MEKKSKVEHLLSEFYLSNHTGQASKPPEPEGQSHSLGRQDAVSFLRPTLPANFASLPSHRPVHQDGAYTQLHPPCAQLGLASSAPTHHRSWGHGKAALTTPWAKGQCQGVVGSERSFTLNPAPPPTSILPRVCTSLVGLVRSQHVALHLAARGSAHRSCVLGLSGVPGRTELAPHSHQGVHAEDASELKLRVSLKFNPGFLG